MSAIATHRAALRQVGRDRRVADLREGRKQRSTRIESAKAYKRTAKHRKAGW